jgi:CRISPR/Cas system-associated exonuclease Cas4 (RecB family)
MDEPLFRLSHTKLSSFDQCHKKYWFGYVARAPKDPQSDTPAGVVGTGVHRAMKVLCDTGNEADGRHELDAYLRMPAHAMAGPGTDYHATAFELFENGCRAHASIQSEAAWSELDTWVPWRSEGIAVTTKVDRADRIDPLHWQVIDWKTGKYDFGEVVDAQLDIAHLVLRTVRKLPREATVTAIGWNLRSGEQRTRVLTREDAAATMRYLSHRARQLQENTEWEATPSPACSFCDWRAQCPDADRAEYLLDEWIEADGVFDADEED